MAETQAEVEAPEALEIANGTTTDAENIDPEAEAEEIEPIDIEQVQKIQSQLPIPDPDAPVGSNKNPIRIIQQGNQYITTQDVSSDHLEQIIQVLTNQALLRGSMAKPSAIFNKQTGKRIIFKVTRAKRRRPNDAVTEKSSIKYDSRHSGDNQKKPRQNHSSDSEETEEEDPDFEPDLPEEEILPFPILRKKTVSGRVSRPPKHLVKDYKHLKLDALEKSDSENVSASDAGYSDFDKNGGDDEDTTVRKDLQCDICDQYFATRAGLARHRGCKHPGAPEVGSTSKSAGRWSSQYLQTIKRKSRLQDALAHATDDDLIEFVAPRIAKIIPPWDHLLMRSEQGELPVPSISHLVFEYFSLAEQSRNFLKEHLIPEEQYKPKEPVVEGQQPDEPCYVIIDGEEQSRSLDLPLGRYVIQEPLKEEILPDKFRAILEAQRNLIKKEAEEAAVAKLMEKENKLKETLNKIKKHNESEANITSPLSNTPTPRGRGRPPGSTNQNKKLREREYADVGYDDEIGNTSLAPLPVPKKRGRPLGSKNSSKKMSDDFLEKMVTYPGEEDEDDQGMVDNGEEMDEGVLERVHDPILNDDLLFMKDGGLGHPVPDEWLQSGAYMAVLNEAGEASDLVVEAASNKLFHKPTGHLVQMASATLQSLANQADDVVQQAQHQGEEGEESADAIPATMVIDETTGKVVDVEAMFPGVTINDLSPGVCIVSKPNGARFQVEHGGEGLTLETLQAVLEMDDQG